jgi:hypothetical protein
MEESVAPKKVFVVEKKCEFEIKSAEGVKYFIDFVSHYKSAFPKLPLPKKYDLSVDKVRIEFEDLYCRYKDKELFIWVAETILCMLININKKIEVSKDASKDVSKKIDQTCEILNCIMKIINSLTNSDSDALEIPLPIMIGYIKDDKIKHEEVSLQGAIFMVLEANYSYFLKIDKEIVPVEIQTHLEEYFEEEEWKFNYKEALRCWLKTLTDSKLDKMNVGIYSSNQGIFSRSESNLISLL